LTTTSPNATTLPLEYSAPAARSAASWSSIFSRLGPLLGLIAVTLLFSALRYRSFVTIGNFELIMRQTAVVGTAALGMTLIIIAGGIDLSVGSAVALVVVVVSMLLPHQLMNEETGETTLTHGVSPLTAALGGIAAGIVIGAINGGLITSLRLAPFIITLGMMSILRGAAQQLAPTGTVYLGPGALNHSFLGELLQPINPRQLWLLSPGVWLWLALALLVSGMLRYTRFGRHIFAIGSNEQTARLCGVPVQRTKFFVYVLGGAFTAAAAVMQISYLGMGDATTPEGMELYVIAAVVIGGASLTGGQGTVLGSIVGALIMTVVANGCNKLGLHNRVQLIVTGVIIILAVALDRLRSRRAE
jgi:ribose/xylose/arabinose/galactoside ABC-type transport system permease subunit